MNIMIAVASKHGATRGIADAIAEQLNTVGGVEAKVHNLAGNLEPGRYDAVILGSAIYMGHLMPAAHAFVDENAGTLGTMPVWLFTSGQLGGEKQVPSRPSVELDRLAGQIGARGRRMFAGQLDREELSLGERLVTAAVHAPEGDFRDWEEIRGWADEIAEALSHPVVAHDAAAAGASPVPVG